MMPASVEEKNTIIVISISPLTTSGARRGFLTVSVRTFQGPLGCRIIRCNLHHTRIFLSYVLLIPIWDCWNLVHSMHLHLASERSFLRNCSIIDLQYIEIIVDNFSHERIWSSLRSRNHSWWGAAGKFLVFPFSHRFIDTKTSDTNLRFGHLVSLSATSQGQAPVRYSDDCDCLDDKAN